MFSNGRLVFAREDDGEGGVGAGCVRQTQLDVPY
jgi:hypothetical protein